MHYKLLHEADGQRTFAVILQTGDEAMSCLQAFAEKERISAAQLTAIGAFREARLGYFDWETKTYQPIPVREQVEVASLVGDIAVADGKPSVHVHAVLGRRDGTALAGHLQEGHVRPTLEIVVTESPTHLCKVKDSESGLALISPRPSPLEPGKSSGSSVYARAAVLGSRASRHSGNEARATMV